MTSSNLLRRYHTTELWAIPGVVVFTYISFFLSNLSIYDFYIFLLVILLTFIVGYGHSLYLNWRLLKPIKILLHLEDQTLDPQAMIELRRQLFELSLKRTILTLERGGISGLLASIFLILTYDLGLIPFTIFIFNILISSAFSSLLVYYAVEKVSHEWHKEIFPYFEQSDLVPELGRNVSLYQKLMLTLTVLMFTLFLLLGTFAFSHFSTALVSVQTKDIILFAAIFVFMFPMTILISFFLDSNITGSIRSMQISMSKAEKVDLITRTPVYSSDEMGEIALQFNNTMKELATIFGKVRELSESVTFFSDRLSSSSITMSEGVELQASSTDTTTTSLDQMQDSISEVADSVNFLFKEMEKTSMSIIEMASSIEEVANNTENLSHSIDTTSSSIEEMNASIKQVAENSAIFNSSTLELARSTDDIILSIHEVERWAIESSGLSNRVTEDAFKGHQAVQKTIEGMDKIHKFFQTSGEVIQELGTRSEQIGNILTVIDDVSSQTNLLALNAAIISAQAGEHGKEFAVVADEIRDLAEKATHSTKEISNLIGRVQFEASKAVETMEEGARLVAEGVKLSHRAGDVLKLITTSSSKSAKMTDQIEHATISQVDRSREIAQIVERLKVMADQIAKATKEQKIGISQIMRESENMRDMATHVKTATEKQTSESRSISTAISDVKEMVERIRVATTQQKSESTSILNAVDIFKDITLKNVDKMVEMDKAVDTLTSQVRSLENQVARFQI